MTIERQIAEGFLLARFLARRGAPWSISERMAHYGVPADSVAVIDDVDIRSAHTWGHLERGSPAPAEATCPFQAASISKSVAAVGALRLVRDGGRS